MSSADRLCDLCRRGIPDCECLSFIDTDGAGLPYTILESGIVVQLRRLGPADIRVQVELPNRLCTRVHVEAAAPVAVAWQRALAARTGPPPESIDDVVLSAWRAKRAGTSWAIQARTLNATLAADIKAAARTLNATLIAKIEAAAAEAAGTPPRADSPRIPARKATVAERVAANLANVEAAARATGAIEAAGRATTAERLALANAWTAHFALKRARVVLMAFVYSDVEADSTIARALRRCVSGEPPFEANPIDWRTISEKVRAWESTERGKSWIGSTTVRRDSQPR